RNRHPASAVRKGANRMISIVMGKGIVPLGHAGCRGANGKEAGRMRANPRRMRALQRWVLSNDACALTMHALQRRVLRGPRKTKRADMVSALLVARLAMIGCRT